MKIIAYSDTHFGSYDTLNELEIKPEYKRCLPFVRYVEYNQPDLVICCGDFRELIYDGEVDYGEIYRKMLQITNIFLWGNHDRAGKKSCCFDGITYAHYNAEVSGHTHVPLLSDKLNLGSLTLNGTFGEIINGKKILHNI